MKRKRRRPARERHDGPIHARLRQLREAKGKDWTQEYVAAALGIDKTAVSHWETGDARPDFEQRIPALAQLYGVSVLDLIRDDPGYTAIQAQLEAA